MKNRRGGDSPVRRGFLLAREAPETRRDHSSAICLVGANPPCRYISSLPWDVTQGGREGAGERKTSLRDAADDQTATVPRDVMVGGGGSFYSSGESLNQSEEITREGAEEGRMRDESGCMKNIVRAGDARIEINNN